MNQGKVSEKTLFWILLLLFISRGVFSIDKELPSFVELPPPIQYFTNSPFSIELKCNVWPSTAKVQFMISSKKPWSNTLMSSQNSVELTPLDHNIGDLVSPGKLRITNQIHLNTIQDQNIHCLTATDFATVLSRPFRVTPAGMSDFGGDITNPVKQSDKTFLRGNVAIIDCWPPESHPRANIKFHINQLEIKEGGRYRIVHWSDGKRVSLLIHPADHSDKGHYRCTATNPVTGINKTSPEVTNLIIEEPQGAVPPLITVPISGRPSGPQHIEARQGTNVTLFCIMRGSPPPQIQIYNYNNDLTANPRYLVDRQFGLLNIRDVQVSDGGTYLCNEKHISSSAILKIVEPLNFTTRPVNVVLDGLSGSARFDCVSSKSSIAVQWFFNGRPVAATPSGSLHIPVVTVTNLGFYQCVAQDHDEWVSAAATLSIKSYNLISQPSIFADEIVQAPLVQNIDQQEQILSAPVGNRIVDNLALFVRWRLASHKLGEVSHYVLQYEQRAKTDAAWSTQITVPEKINTTFYYATSRLVEAQNSYRFRVHAFFTSGHTLTSNWGKETDFYNVGKVAPVIEECLAKSPTTLSVMWSYSGAMNWPVDTFRIMYRQSLTNGSSKFSPYTVKDVVYPNMNTSIDGLEPGSSYQIIVYGIRETMSDSKAITIYSQLHTVSLPPLSKTTQTTTPSSTTRFFAGLLESWKGNKLLYGSLFALTGFLILVMFLLLLLCLCRQRRFRNNKDSSSSHTFPYAYKEVSKSSSAANNNNSSTLQIPGRMPQYSSQLALQQFQPNNGSIDRRNMDTSSQIHRTGSSQAMETSSLVTDLYGGNYMHGQPMSGHMQQHGYQGFSTLPQGYPSSQHHQHNRNNPQYQHFLQQQQQQQQAHMGSIRRGLPTGDSNRDSMIDQSMEMPTRGMSASQQHLMAMQNQEQQQQRSNLGYYNTRAGAMSPQMMMMMGSQQSLGPYAPYRRSNSQNYQGHMETPIALSPSGHPLYQMDQMIVDPQTGRPLSPQYLQQQYIQQQQQQQQLAAAAAAQQQGSMHPSMLDMYNQAQGYVRPGANEYNQQSLYRQQYRRSDSDCGAPEPGYAYLPTGQGQDVIAAARQHALNSLPEQPMDIGRSSQQQHARDSPGNMGPTHSNNSSSGRHHHRRKTRNRPQNSQDSQSLERVQGNEGDMPPMLAPRSKVPYPDMNPGDVHDASTNECTSESNVTGDQFEPPLQYSGQYNQTQDNEGDQEEGENGNSSLIEHLPRIRDVSEYGISNHASHQAPVPPLKSTARQRSPSNGYGAMHDPSADYYSSATSSDRSGPSPPPKYAPALAMGHGRPGEEAYLKNHYYQHHHHSDTHC